MGAVDPYHRTAGIARFMFTLPCVWVGRLGIAEVVQSIYFYALISIRTTIESHNLKKKKKKIPLSTTKADLGSVWSQM